MECMDQPNSSAFDCAPYGNGETVYVVGMDDFRGLQVQNSADPACSFAVPHFTEMPDGAQQGVGPDSLSEGPIYIVQRKTVDSDAIPLFDLLQRSRMQRHHHYFHTGSNQCLRKRGYSLFRATKGVWRIHGPD